MWIERHFNGKPQTKWTVKNVNYTERNKKRNTKFDIDF